ncbi:serine/threonine RGC [Schistosoma mansoni]|uniref:serine/threonine RGC n=1 Tax=Schistosoma mansoni TaxID=6183 RepID=UPI0001A6211A|nr:serine/threonine RGC [Schistosoma mansoni]|eukprot:XP_018653073.1 serine/threonine RGC [Schistosoma mansoni]
MIATKRNFNIVWINEPPNEWSIDKMIRIRFFATASSSFYGQAIQLNIFSRNPLLSDCVPVAMKQIYVEFTELTSDMQKQLWEVKKMKHNNLVKLIGVTFISPVLSLYTEFCDRGSLCYVLRRDSIPLSWSLRIGFLTGLANGLAYLHNYHIVHGRLNSSNCVVSDTWTCKITDYGLDSLIWSNNFEKHKTFLDKPENLPYIPPEYRGKYYKETLFVPAVDIYSFGTIMWETASRSDPSQDDEFVAEPMYNHPELPTKRRFETDVKYEVTTVPPFEEYNNLMESCWSEVTLRPNLNTIIEWLTKINPRNIGVDTGTILVSKYARCLESIIEDRTQALRSEQKMADTLLNSMLPKQVVEMLRHGENVPPEAFEQCTIYFSDIVGFTTISSSSTPFEVVEFLNKLYTQFDDIIDRYDVYKVETIGDAYMVASGVPRRNGERHAIAIADMSLDLVSVSHSFVIPHKPDEPLKIRVGLHSGPVCAGVVGLKMPRYCLFGDTVNTASRMESTGEAYKIHCSETTHAILDRLGGFTFEKRGTITVKGKGDMQTWWITGRTRADLAKDCCPLPLNWKKRLKKSENPNPNEDH